MPALRFPSAVPLLARLLAAVPLGYAFVALCVSALGALIAQAGMARADAVVLAAMLGFVLYLAWLVWVLAARSLLRVYAALAAGATSSAAVLWLLPPTGA